MGYLRHALWSERASDLCFYCEREMTAPALTDDRKHPLMATVEHRQPLSRGGDRHDRQNAVLACRDCNELKGNMTEAEFTEAVLWLVENGHEIERVPGKHVRPLANMGVYAMFRLRAAA